MKLAKNLGFEKCGLDDLVEKLELCDPRYGFHTAIQDAELCLRIVLKLKNAALMKHLES